MGAKLLVVVAVVPKGLKGESKDYRDYRHRANAEGSLIMALITIICPNCRHIGAVRAAALPCVLSCSVCGDRRLIQNGFKVKNRWTEAVTATKPLELIRRNPAPRV